MNLEKFNTLPEVEAREILLRSCHSTAWVNKVLQNRPYASESVFRNEIAHLWFGLTEEDWLDAFRAHPMIGDIDSLRSKFSNTKEMASREQGSALASAREEELGELSKLNQEYLEKFGFIFIIFATGKSAKEMLYFLRERIVRSRSEEIRTAAEEQLKITLLRLEKSL